jgi:EpsD family peptidyl-prolyl cis-trans isomerase
MSTVTRACQAIGVAGLCLIVLAGCSKKDEGAASSGQIIARVGTEDVTIQELENELRLANIPADKQKDPATTRQFLGELVLRKYLLQQAMEAKLDREPAVLLDILRARTQILANAVLARKIANQTVSRTDLDSYIAKNPGKFANRELVSVEQVSFAMTANAQSVIDANKEAKTLDEVDRQLASIGAQHSRSMATLDSSELPTDLFNAMQAKRADDVFFIRAAANGVFFKVIGETPRPLEGEAAVNVARQLIKADMLKAELGMASVSANLEAKYEGVYTKIMENPGAKN